MKKYLKQIRIVDEMHTGATVVEYFIAAPHSRCCLVDGKLSSSAAVGIMCANGYKFHTTDDRRYHFTCPNGNPVSFNLQYLRAYAIGLVLTFQLTEEYQKEEKKYLQPSE